MHKEMTFKAINVALVSHMVTTFLKPRQIPSAVSFNLNINHMNSSDQTHIRGGRQGRKW